MSISLFLILFNIFEALFRSVSCLGTSKSCIHHDCSVLHKSMRCSCRRVFRFFKLPSLKIPYGSWPQFRLNMKLKKRHQGLLTAPFKCKPFLWRFIKQHKVSQVWNTVSGTVQMSWWFPKKLKIKESINNIVSHFKNPQLMWLLLFCLPVKKFNLELGGTKLVSVDV